MEKRPIRAIKLLLLLWMHSMVACLPIIHCPLARNFVEYGPNGKIVDCIRCPECVEGYGLSIPCGSTITNESTIECVPCVPNKTYSNGHGIGNCRTCQYCGLRNIVRPCSRSQNRKCGNKCPKGYFFDHNIEDCVEVKSAVTATVKSTESTPAVRQDPNPSIKTKKHLTTEDFLIKPSTSQPQLSSVVTGITLTASLFRTTTGGLLAEYKDTTSVSPRQSGQEDKTTHLTVIAILAAVVFVFVPLPIMIFLLVCKKRREHPRPETESTDTSTSEAVDEPKILEDYPASSMEQLCDEKGDTMLFYVQTKLDAVEKPTKKTWRSVGRSLQVCADDLDLIEAECVNGKSATEVLLSKLKTFKKEPTMGEFVQALKKCQRYDVANYICNWPWKELIAKGEGKDYSAMSQSQPAQDKRK